MQEKKPDPEYETWLVHGMKQYSGGHAIGKVLDEINSESRTGYVFSPRDLNIPKELNKNKNISVGPYTLFFNNEHIEELKLSSHVKILFASPPKAEYFNKQFKETAIGQLFMKLVEDRNDKIEIQEILRSKTEKQNKMLMQTEGLEIAEDTISTMAESAKSIAKAARVESTKPFGTVGHPGGK